MPASDSLIIVDGSLDFSGGINSVKVTTIASQQNPGGLARNELAWLVNGGLRDGGITPRAGWQPIGFMHSGDVLYQGGFMYQPIGDFPYLVHGIGGVLYRQDTFTGEMTPLSGNPALYHPSDQPYFYFEQAEEFLVIQAGDNVTLPLFWDGTTLRRSNGITGNVGQPGPAVYTITTTNFFVVPAIGGTVTLFTLETQGIADGQVLRMRAPGSSFDVGTFSISATMNDVSFDITTVTSDWIGHNFPPHEYIFTDTAPFVPVLINEIPAATTMFYYMGRLWYAQGRQFTAGDIVFGDSGTAAYGFRDSVLKVTENPLAIGGDGFVVQLNDGIIRALHAGGAIDAALGQGRLFIFTARTVYALQVPVSRDAWIAAGNDNQPLLVVVQLVNGSVNDRSVVPANGDLFYQSLEPGIRSLIQSVRYFQQSGNVQISANENRILQFNDRSLLHFATGVVFNNRMLQSALPMQSPSGVVHQALIPMDFVPINSFNKSAPPNWEGVYDGMLHHQLFRGDFGGRERAFSVVRQADGALWLWELTTNDRFENGDNRIQMQIEWPSFTWGKEFDLKKVVTAELWVDRLYGTVEFTLEYRPDGSTCWFPWHTWQECSPRNSAEDCANPITYPLVQYGECYRQTMTMPKPPEKCGPCATGWPAYIGYQIQPRLTTKGYCRVRAILLHAEKFDRKLYQNITC